jgi:hypothetical protein
MAEVLYESDGLLVENQSHLTTKKIGWMDDPRK